MFFGGFSGAVAFYPDKVSDVTDVPPVVLTDFKLFGSSVDLAPASPLKKSITYSDSISLSHAQTFFLIEFSAPSYANSAANRYRYKLEGLQTEWTETDSAQRVATYTTLPEGSYTFRVQGATGRGSWSEPGTTLKIEILPPFWRTAWFRTIGGTLLLVSLWAVYRTRLHQITSQHSLRLEERYQERSRIARELHDTLLQSFQGLVLRFQAAQTMLPERPLDAKHSFQIAIGRAAEAITEGRHAVQELRGTSPDSEDLVKRLTVIGQQLAADHNAERGGQEHGERSGHEHVEFRILVDGAARPWRGLSVPEEICQIVREALTNAFRHAQARRIELDIRFGAQTLQFGVRDDGVGMDMDLLPRRGRDGHWGLPGMHERANKIGARLEVWSEGGRGTEIQLRLRSAIAYSDSPRRLFGLLNRGEEET